MTILGRVWLFSLLVRSFKSSWVFLIVVFDKVFMQSQYHFLLSFKGGISKTNCHTTKEKVSLSKKTSSGIHGFITG